MRHRDIEIVLGVLPLSHALGLIVSHGTIYLRDRLILHTKFDMKAALMSIQMFRINRLYLVPPVLAALVGNPFLFKAFDLSSVDTVFVGAGILSVELHGKTKAVQPHWNLINGYGNPQIAYHPRDKTRLLTEYVLRPYGKLYGCSPDKLQRAWPGSSRYTATFVSGPPSSRGRERG